MKFHTISLIGGVAALSLLFACTPKEQAPAPAAVAVPVAVPATPVAPPTTAQKIDAILMKAVFGKDYRPATGDALTMLPDSDLDNRKVLSRHVVSPVANMVLKSGETVLVANAEMADDNGEASSGHPSPGLLNVFVLRQADGKWTVLKRHENVDTLGSDGHFGAVSWPVVGQGRQGMAVMSGSSGGGSSIESVSLYDITGGDLRPLTRGTISIKGGNENNCDAELSGDCISVTGKWSFAEPKTAADYYDLLIAFTGEESKQPDDDERKPTGPRVVTKKINSTSRYAFDGKQYQLVDGTDPVPGF